MYISCNFVICLLRIIIFVLLNLSESCSYTLSPDIYIYDRVAIGDYCIRNNFGENTTFKNSKGILRIFQRLIFLSLKKIGKIYRCII